MSAKGPGRPRHASHDEVRAVAFALFEEKGYAATSLSEIARAVGVSRTTLFSYFPAKRDLMWDEFDAGAERMRQSLAASTDLPAMDAIVAALLAVAQYSPADHESFVTRRRIVYADDELRAAAAHRTAELSREILDDVYRRTPDIDRERAGDVIRALMSVGEGATADWIAAPEVGEALDAYMAARLRPFIEALRPLLS